eukprot:3478798-Prymnesium_polylepis.1
MGDAVGTAWSVLAGEKITLIQLPGPCAAGPTQDHPREKFTQRLRGSRRLRAYVSTFDTQF